MNNKITNNLVRTTGNLMNKKEALPHAYKILKNSYDDFVQSMNKSDFANSPRRYMSELTYVRTLKNFAQENNLLQELKTMADKEESLLKKLADLGVTYNS